MPRSKREPILPGRTLDSSGRPGRPPAVTDQRHAHGSPARTGVVSFPPAPGRCSAFLKPGEVVMAALQGFHRGNPA